MGRGGKRQCIINVFLCGAAEISPGGDLEGLRVFLLLFSFSRLNFVYYKSME